MLIAEIIFSIIAAILIGVLFYYVFRYSGPWGSFWSFLLILILAGLAASAWINPIGPVFYDIAWIPILFVILLFALLLGAASDPVYRRRIEYREATPEADTEREGEAAGATLGLIFWIFLTFLVVAAVWGAFL